MSDIDISRLLRLVPTALTAQPELQGTVLPILEAADSDGEPNAEDGVLTDAEAEAYIARYRAETRRSLSLVTSNREALVGTLRAAQTRLRGQEGAESVLPYLALAAGQDYDPENLSAEEITLLVQEFTQMVEQAGGLNAVQLGGNVRSLLTQLEALEASMPEAFLPTEPAAQRAPIDLNFLKHIPDTLLSSEAPELEELRGLLRTAGVDLNDREADWSLTFEEAQTQYEQLPDDIRQILGSPEMAMANFRFIAHQMRGEVNASISAVDESVPELHRLGLSLEPLIERLGQINDPRVDQLLGIAGDATLTTLEVERYLQLAEEQNPGLLAGMVGPATEETEGQSELQRATAVYMAGARSLVASYAEEAVGEPGPSEGTALDANTYLSLQVLDDLERMRAGFTHRDRQYAEENTLVGAIDFITYVCTLGGALTWLGAGSPPSQSDEDIASGYGDILPRLGPTYRHLVRESVDSHDAERGRALAELRRIVEHRPSDFEGDMTIPNALEYLRTHDDSMGIATGRGLDAGRVEGSRVAGTGEGARYYELLTGQLYRADRLWQIRSETDLHRAEDMWYDFAQELRGGTSAFYTDGIHSAGLSNLDYSRAILGSLVRTSPTASLQLRADQAMQDSLGQDILDAEGNVIEVGNGEFGLVPIDWFRNYSDENRDGVGSDIILLVASLFAGGGLFKFGQSVMTAAGRSAIGAGLLRFFGVRATQTAVAETAVGAAVEGGGLFGRRMALWATRRVAAAETALDAAITAGATEAEVLAARSALARARWMQGVLTAPTAGGIAEAAAPMFTGRAAAIVNAHPPVASFLSRVAGGTGARAIAARATVATLQNISLRGLGRGLRYLSFEGICIYAIASQIFMNAPRHGNQPLNFSRTYELGLPGDREAPSAPRPDAGADADAEADAPPADASAPTLGDAWDSYEE